MPESAKKGAGEIPQSYCQEISLLVWLRFIISAWLFVEGNDTPRFGFLAQEAEVKRRDRKKERGTRRTMMDERKDGVSKRSNERARGRLYIKHLHGRRKCQKVKEREDVVTGPNPSRMALPNHNSKDQLL